ncbi:MAG: histidine phosphatase family protein [Colwellia sp.]|nr:histidine phosphatase family protein [Colwellia sp.]
MLEIELIRHVKVTGKPALYGCTDIEPIANENRRLLKYLVAQQKTTNAYQVIVCSPLIRCQVLAREFSEACHLPFEVSPDLQEMNFGCFDGVPFDDIPFSEAESRSSIGQNRKLNEQRPELHWSQLEAFFQAPADIVLPEAETLAVFHHRVINAWKNLLEQHIAIATKQTELKTPRRVLVIVHGGVIRMILAHILQLDWQQASWHQKLQIGHGSLSRVFVSQPYQDKKQCRKPTPEPHQQQPQYLYQQPYQQLHQQVTAIAIPLLEES